LIDELKRNRVEHFKEGDLEIKFSPLAFLPDEVTNAPLLKDQIDDELLFYSSVSPRMA
jgi:hypothetical protein